jgi:IS30 family transposase
VAGTLVHRRPHGAEAIRDAIAETITPPPAARRSLAWGQETETAIRAVPTETGPSVNFCDPHSSWQRGTNESANGLLRQ